MVAFTKIVTTIHVWLTALMTLVAGIPQLRCGCSDVDVKTSPSAPASQPAHRCCCCAKHQAGGEPAASSDEIDECSCCQQSTARPPTDPETQPAAGLQKPHCIKELQRTDAVAPTRTEKNDPQGQAVAQLSQVVPVCLPVLLPSPRIGGLPLLPPPTDLVTLLRHLLI